MKKEKNEAVEKNEIYAYILTVLRIVYFFLSAFFLIGLLLHTSRQRIILQKYSLSYFTGILLILFFLVVLYFLLKYILYREVFKQPNVKMSKSLVFRNFVFILIGLIIVIILPIEAFLRFKYKNVEGNSYKYSIDSFHPFLQSQLSASDNVHINTQGFRGEEISIKKPENTYRIVVLGGSTVLNREVEYEKNAVRLLEKKLRKHYPEINIEVINAGKDAYSSEHSIIQYLFKIKDFSPDLVITWQGVNDMYTSCTPSEAQIGQFRSDYSHSLGAVSRMAQNYFHPLPLFQIKLISFDFFQKFIQDNLYTDILLSIRNNEIAKDVRIYAKSGKNFVTEHSYPSLESYKRNMNSFINILHEDNVKLILGNQPNLYKKNMSLDEVRLVYLPTLVCMKDGKYYSLDSIKYGFTLFNNETLSIAENAKISFIDLDKAVAKNTSNFLDAVHTTESGNEIIAQSLYDFIVRNAYIKQ